MTTGRRFFQYTYQVLIVLAAGILCVYAFAAYPFYCHMKAGTLQEAWAAIKEMDLSGLDEEDEEILKSFELEKLEILIADEDYKLVYATKNSEYGTQIEGNIIRHVEKYEEDARVTVRKYREIRTLRVRGLAVQKGEKYYVYIRKQTMAAQEVTKMSVIYFACGIAVLWLCGYLMERRRKKAEAQLEMEEEQGQEKLEQVRKEFVANVSHELKTPLAVISGQVEMLQSMGDKIDREYYFASIREEIDKMSALVGDLLDITVMEHNVEQMEFCTVNLSDMMDYMVLKYDALFRKNKVKVATSIEKDVLVSGNSMYLEQAVNNYIMNAFQHTAQGKKMSINLIVENGYARIGVYNEGPCITKKDMEQIWQSFYANSKAKLKKEQKISNAGLGLYLVKKIVIQHKGKCGVENKADGVEFWIYLPMTRRGEG